MINGGSSERVVIKGDSRERVVVINECVSEDSD